MINLDSIRSYVEEKEAHTANYKLFPTSFAPVLARVNFLLERFTPCSLFTISTRTDIPSSFSQPKHSHKNYIQLITLHQKLTNSLLFRYPNPYPIPLIPFKFLILTLSNPLCYIYLLIKWPKSAA